MSDAMELAAIQEEAEPVYEVVSGGRLIEIPPAYHICAWQWMRVPRSRATSGALDRDQTSRSTGLVQGVSFKQIKSVPGNTKRIDACTW